MSKKYLITSALPYVNGDFHIGHLVGCLVPSDVYARFCRAMGRDVLYICGADEHGTPAVVGAKKAGMSVLDYVTDWYEKQKKSARDFHFSFDGGYGRTHTDRQASLVQGLFSRLDQNGFVEEKTTIQPYSVDDATFLTDRQIEGTCPKCGFARARGDQCDQCGELLDPVDLINPYVAETGGKNIEMRETKNIFYRADLVKDRVTDWFQKNHSLWSETAISNTKKYLTEDVPNPSITRDMSWGIPVNKPGYEDKVFYVWFDAPWGYVSISMAASENWADWWKNDDTHYAQFMAKDNTKFHAIFFPGQEIALDDGWKKVDQLKVMNFLNFEGGKISKSTGNGIFAAQAVEEAPADTWRYALIASAPETDDTDFSIQRFADIVNKDLNGMLGNFVSRVTKLTEKNFENKVPERVQSSEFRVQLDELEVKINRDLAELTVALDKCEFRRAVAALRNLWAIGNEFMTEMAPWSLVKNGDLDGAGAILNECFQLIDFYARVSMPFIPDAAGKMQGIFEESGIRNQESVPSWPKTYERRIADGAAFVVPENLFNRIDNDAVTAMIAKYANK